MITDKEYTGVILAMLDKFTAQRSGLDWRNYGSAASYRSEQRSITRDLHHYRALRGAVSWREFSREQWADAFRAYSGRLTLTHDDNGRPYRLDYCTGQYFPTEYRRAACAVLASLLWSDARENMPAPAFFYVYCRADNWQSVLATSTKFATRGDAEKYAATVAASRCPDVSEIYGPAELRAGDYLRAKFAREFGRTIARRWFN